MKYKGFVISPSYFIGGTFRITKDGRVINRKPTNKDIEYYEIFDPMENMNRWGAEFTISDCKTAINEVLSLMNMKDNTPSSWAKLDN